MYTIPTSIDYALKKKLQYTFFHKLDTLPADIPLSEIQKKHLEVLEICHTEDMQLVYLLVNVEDRNVLLLQLQLILFDHRHYKPISNNKFTESVFAKLISCFKFKIMVVGNLFAEDGIGIFPLEQNQQMAEIILHTLEYCQHIYDAGLIIVKDYELDQSRPLGYKKYLSRAYDISMQMQICPHWKTLSDYEKDLKHKYAQRFRKVKKSANKLIIKKLTKAEVSKYKTELHNLYCNVLEKQPIKLGIAHADYFLEMKSKLDDKYIIYAYIYEEKIVAFNSLIIYDTIQETHFIGMNYEVSKALQLYFVMLLQSLHHAIENNIAVIQFGRNALEAKAILGATPLFHNTYYRINNPITNKLVYRLADNFTNQLGQSWKNRHPFKQEKQININLIWS